MHICGSDGAIGGSVDAGGSEDGDEGCDDVNEPALCSLTFRTPLVPEWSLSGRECLGRNHKN